jgi:regulator of protease activity HflC (stomatin/prohibitin superfamily)
MGVAAINNRGAHNCATEAGLFIQLIDQVATTISIIGWILFGILCLIAFIRILFRRGPARAFRFLLSLPVLITAGLLILISTLSYAILFIPPQEVAVVPSLISPRGIRPQALRPGFQIIFPFVEEAIEYPTYWQTYTMSGSADGEDDVDDGSIRARTSDGQEVYLDCSVIFRIDPNQAVLVHVAWQNRYRDDFLRPLVRGEVRTQVSQFTVEEVNSSARRDLEVLLNNLLTDELSGKGFVLDQFILRDITFSPEYGTAVEQKQVALEGQFQRQYEAEQVRLLAAGRADALLIEAQAQAEALRVIGQALEENPELLHYHYIDRLTPNIQAMLLPAGNQFILPLPELAPTSTLTLTDTLTSSIALPSLPNIPITETVSPLPD